MPATGELRTASALASISTLGKLLRADEWLGVAFIPLFLPFYYLLLAADRPLRESCGLFVLVLVFGFLCGSFGFVINTLFDREQDRKAGKRYAMTEWPERRIVLLLAFLTLAAVLVLLPLALRNRGFVILAAASFILATAYSARGLRFKEHPILGPVTFSLSQFAIPQLYVFMLFDYLHWETLLSFALFFVLGLRVILLHQLLDYANDRHASVLTFATRYGIERTWLLFSKALTPIEFFVLAWALAIGGRQVPGTLAFAACCGIVFVFWRHLSPGASSVLPMQSSALLGFYWVFWPLFLLAMGIPRSRFFLVLLLFHLLITVSFWKPYWGELRSALRRMTAPMRLIAGLLAAYLAGQLYFHLSPVLGYHKSLWMTPAVTLLFFAFSAGHAALRLGKMQTAAFITISSVITLAAEILGVRTGAIFGPYRYSDRLGWQVFGVPLFVPFAWFMMIYSSYDLAGLILGRHRLAAKGGWVLALTGAIAMTAWDLVMDPQMVAEGFWTWTERGAFFGIPTRNFAGWLAITFTVYGLYGLAARRVPSDPDARATGSPYFLHLPAVAYLFTSLSSSVSALQRDQPMLFAIGVSTLGALVLATIAPDRS